MQASASVSSSDVMATPTNLGWNSAEHGAPVRWIAQGVGPSTVRGRTAAARPS
jgi:hypothetical protein